jgi:type I restriction-modification system DNA methylase subunit
MVYFEASRQTGRTDTDAVNLFTSLQAFSEGKTVLQVAIALNLRDHEVRDDYFDIFGETDTIQLDPDSLVYVIGELQIFAITEADRDVIGDAFEVFIGKGLRGEEGQFFTPRNVVRMMVEILNPSSQEFILDPACGSGGFLIVALGYVWQRIDEEGKRKNWSTVNREKKNRGCVKIFLWYR